jgi:hypothetical protein
MAQSASAVNARRTLIATQAFPSGERLYLSGYTACLSVLHGLGRNGTDPGGFLGTAGASIRGLQGGWASLTTRETHSCYKILLALHEG